MSTVRTALLVGGGIAGPVTAAALRKAGIDATIYEAYPGPADGIGGTLALAPNGLNALRVINADDAVRSIALPITRSIMTMGGAKVMAMPTLADLPPLQVVNRGELYRVLHDAAEAHGARTEYGKRLVDVQENADSITARFADGSTATGDILIGADGIHSTVRKLIDPNAPDADFTGLLGLGGVSEHQVSGKPGTMVFAFGKKAFYIYWTRPDGRTEWGANLPAAEAMSFTEARDIPVTEWLARCRNAYADDKPGRDIVDGTPAAALGAVGALYIMPPVPHWHRGRMTLVGDAVHAPSNSSGQGASLSIESGIELARCLRDMPDVESALAVYAAARKPRVDKVAARAAKINQAKAPGTLARKVISFAMPVMFKMMNFEKTMGAEQRYTIDWDAPVQSQLHLTV